MEISEYEAKIEELEKRCAYFQAQAHELAGSSIKNDAALSTTRMRLKQKEQAFQLLSKLQSSMGVHEDTESIINRILKTLQTQMKMTQSILFLADGSDSSILVPHGWLGYRGEQIETLTTHPFPEESPIKRLGDFILSTKDQPVAEITKRFFEWYGVRYFICVPVVLHNKITGILLASRSRETKPFYPTLNTGDVETLKSIAGFLSITLENRDLYTNLEQKVEERTQELSEKSAALQKAQSLINESLHYALNLQLTLLPDDVVKTDCFNDFFAIWEPMGIVGGDIYFIYPTETGCLLFVIDCTGHGIPGAFMTMIAGAALENIISRNLLHDPGLILMAFDRFVTRTLKQHQEGAKSDNGMDMGVCRIDKGSDALIYAGAKFSLYKFRDQEPEIIKGDRRSIGYRGAYSTETFTNHVIPVAANDTFYICSDGLQDQVGGPKRRSFGRRRMLEFMSEISVLPFDQQPRILQNKLKEWQGNEDRRDDVTIVGFRCLVWSE